MSSFVKILNIKSIIFSKLWIVVYIYSNSNILTNKLMYLLKKLSLDDCGIITHNIASTSKVKDKNQKLNSKSIFTFILK